MKFISSTLITLALSALAAVAVPATSPANELERRAEACRVRVDGARCRRTPSSSDIIGEFFTGNTPTFTCKSTGPTVSGTKTTIGGVACFVSDSLLDLPCPNNLPACPV
ncbi:hypothetical protein C8J57DRAFT_1235483 [Mycena rebaudengoi]|nr:hypothetical protein C8J57DRAFT_1235483 [Mycena rebaudengoi]